MILLEQSTAWYDSILMLGFAFAIPVGFIILLVAFRQYMRVF